jgi:hypothetical protein
MNGRVSRALKDRLVAGRAQIRAARNLTGWKRHQRIQVPIGTQLPVVMCTWRRLERLPRTLEQLAAQDVAVQALIWNNNPETTRVDAAAAAAAFPVAVHHSARNIGGFGRFYLAREAAEAGHRSVIFIDDDQEFEPTTIRELVEHHRAHSLSGWWAFRFPGGTYGRRVPAAPGESASYVGTGGMIVDTAIFRHARLFRCPRRYWFVEDLWLCYVAHHLAGFDLFKSPAHFEIAEDGCDQYLALGHTKWRFLRYLIRQGWEPVQGDTGSSGQTVKNAATDSAETA